MKRNQLVVFFAAAVAAYGQIAPFRSDGIQMSSTNTQLMAVPAAAAPTLLNLAVDTSLAGGDLIDVTVGDPSVAISLITPLGTEVNAANAASYGFTFSTYTADGGASDSLSPLTSAGTHNLIQFSASQASGSYQIKADASLASADTAMIVQYYSSSTVRAGAVTDSSHYRTGDLVATSLLLFDGTAPVQGATVTATAATLVPLPSDSVGSYQLVSQQAFSSTTTLYTYTAQLTHPGASATSVSAQVSSSDPNTTVVDSSVLFGDVGAGGTATSLNTFSVQLPNSSTFNPAVLSWQVVTPSAPISFTLTDSGTYDAATGDGIYTGTFTPSIKGAYTVFLTGSGTSSSGAAFSRAVTAALQVSDPLARIGALSDTPVYQNSLIDHVAITAPVNVQIAGTYQLTLDLQASNGKSTQATVSTSLAAGSQQMVLNFPFANLRSLGTNGPYVEAHARLVSVSNAAPTLADYIDNAGSTQTYLQSAVSPGPLAFTGQNTAAGVITGSGPTFDLLRVTMGVYSAAANSCRWYGTLTDLAGNEIASSSSGGSVIAGGNVITLDFNGNQIAKSVDGPYLIKYVGVTCGRDEATARTLFQTQSFTASQFTFVASDFTLAVQSSPPGATAGSTFQYRIYITAVGPFSAIVHLSVAGLPAGAAISFTVPDVHGFGPSYLNVTTTTGTPLGVYPLTVSGTSGTLSHAASTTLTVQ